jgi:hypothetical protein
MPSCPNNASLAGWMFRTCWHVPPSRSRAAVQEGPSESTLSLRDPTDWNGVPGRNTCIRRHKRAQGTYHMSRSDKPDRLLETRGRPQAVLAKPFHVTTVDESRQMTGGPCESSGPSIMEHLARHDGSTPPEQIGCRGEPPRGPHDKPPRNGRFRGSCSNRAPRARRRRDRNPARVPITTRPAQRGMDSDRRSRPDSRAGRGSMGAASDGGPGRTRWSTCHGLSSRAARVQVVREDRRAQSCPERLPPQANGQRMAKSLSLPLTSLERCYSSILYRSSNGFPTSVLFVVTCSTAAS